MLVPMRLHRESPCWSIERMFLIDGRYKAKSSTDMRKVRLPTLSECSLPDIEIVRRYRSTYL